MKVNLMNEVNIKEENKQVDLIFDNARFLEIKNNEDYKNATNELKIIKSKSKELDEKRKTITKPIDSAKKEVLALFKNPQEILIKAEKLIKASILNFQEKQENLRLEEENKLQAKIEKDKEIKRKALEERIKKEEEKGNLKTAEKLKDKLNELSLNIMPTISSNLEKIRGVTTKKIWKYKIIDEQKIPREFSKKVPDNDKIKKFINAMQDSIPIPGIEIYQESIISCGSML